MSVPAHCTVLVIGGGPAGSYTTSALAREGVDVVLLEADIFPRYHIGESMIASMRYFLRFIDLESTFDNYGFQKKHGATFKLNAKPAAYTDFSESLGPGGYAWNVVRSEADQLFFDHAGKCGAKTFDGTKVDHIEFKPFEDQDYPEEPEIPNPGLAVSANWSRKDGSSGKITFDYIVDASGRAGLIATKYLKNRLVNEGLKNLANWAYWKGAATYNNAERDKSTFFEALLDGSGWCWAIPLHNGTLSVGVVMRQDIFFAKKKDGGSPSSMDWYKECIKQAPIIEKLLENAEVVSDTKQASDWSYSASTYAGPNFRLAGDSGCFIDPYFSSGVHLALAGALSSAVTIQAVRRGECDKYSASKWHSTKVTEGYTRFLIVVMTTLRQLRKQNLSLLGDKNDTGFESAFKAIQPVIQGVADSDNTNKVQERAVGSVDFALDIYHQASPKEQKAVLEKTTKAAQEPTELEKLTPKEIAVLQNLRERQLRFFKEEKDLEHFTNDSINGFSPNVVRGSLGLIRRTNSQPLDPVSEPEILDFLKMDARNESNRNKETTVAV